MKTFKITGYAGAKASVVIDFNLPPDVPRTTSVQNLAPAKGKGDAYTDPNYNYAALYTFFIFPVPFTVEIDTQLNYESTMSASTTGHIQGPGFWFEESYTMGAYASSSAKPASLRLLLRFFPGPLHPAHHFTHAPHTRLP